ncbi:MAG: hypothetical protein EHM50_09780 [Lysobacterales bacterium]|nr:MAG: hypothetical protein EHM50_09780 [Xanthomonadales bacterium]
MLRKAGAGVCGDAPLTKLPPPPGGPPARKLPPPPPKLPPPPPKLPPACWITVRISVRSSAVSSWPVCRFCISAVTWPASTPSGSSICRPPNETTFFPDALAGPPSGQISLRSTASSTPSITAVSGTSVSARSAAVGTAATPSRLAI